MQKPNLDKLEKKAIKKSESRERKRRLKMKVSGASVKKLQKIIGNRKNF